MAGAWIWTKASGGAITIGLLLAVGLAASGFERSHGDETETFSGSQAADPAEGSIRWGETVEWEGGPLNGGLVGIDGFAMVVVGACLEGACDEFRLDIQVEPSPSANRVRFVHVAVEPSSPSALVTVIIPPGGDPDRDFTMYEQNAARLIDPEPGVWRIRVVCVPCSDTTYTANATTGSVRIPMAVSHHAGAEVIKVRPDVRGRVDQVGANAHEPTLGIAQDGSVFYQAGIFAIPKVLRSTDGGDHWENVSPTLGPLPRHPQTADPFLHVDRDTSRVFTVDNMPPLVCTEISFTDDGGTDWTTTSNCEHIPDHQNLFSGPPVLSEPIGYPNVVYWCVNGNAETMSVCSKSLDGGLTFVPTGTPAFTNAWPVNKCDVGLTGHGSVGPDGSVYLPRGFCGEPFVGISRDEGLTWTQVQVADNGMPLGNPVLVDAAPWVHEAGIAADADGTLHYAWVAYDRLPYLASSTDGGLTWSQPLMIGPPGVNETAFPTIDVAPAGRVAVAYLGTENSPGGPPFPGELDCEEIAVGPDSCPGPDEAYEGVTWNGYITVTDAALDDDPVFVTATVNDPNDPLVIGVCGPWRCHGDDFFDIVVASDGTPWAAFIDACVVDLCDALQDEGIVGRLMGLP